MIFAYMYSDRYATGARTNISLNPIMKNNGQWLHENNSHVLKYKINPREGLEL